MERRATIEISGMSCGHCVEAIRSGLDGIEGVEVEEVTIGSAVVRYDDEVVDPTDLFEAINEAGYEVRAD